MIEIDWAEVAKSLEDHSHASLGQLLDDESAKRLAAAYDDEAGYRSRVVMARHGFGRGEYKYYDHPLPLEIASLRKQLYPGLADIANTWEERLSTGRVWPATHSELLQRCHAEGQTKPTPLILRYGSDDYNCLHQDIYGALTFPLQVVILLSDEADFEGGEFVLTEQRPRMQSRAEVVRLRQGEGVVFPVNERPKRGTRGYYRVKQRHGVSRILSGTRHTLGIIFHDAA